MSSEGDGRMTPKSAREPGGINNRNISVASKLKQLEDAMTTRLPEFGQVAGELKVDWQNMLNRYEDKKTRVEELQKQLKDQMKSYEHLQDDYDALRRQNDVSRVMVCDYKSRLSESQLVVKDLTTWNKQLQHRWKKRAEKCDRLINIKSELQNCKRTVRELNSATLQIQRQLKARDEECSRLRNKVRRYEANGGYDLEEEDEESEIGRLKKKLVQEEISHRAEIEMLEHEHQVELEYIKNSSKDDCDLQEDMETKWRGSPRKPAQSYEKKREARYIEECRRIAEKHTPHVKLDFTNFDSILEDARASIEATKLTLDLA